MPEAECAWSASYLQLLSALSLLIVTQRNMNKTHGGSVPAQTLGQLLQMRARQSYGIVGTFIANRNLSGQLLVDYNVICKAKVNKQRSRTCCDYNFETPNHTTLVPTCSQDGDTMQQNQSDIDVNNSG